MGCDIHTVVQQRVDGHWRDLDIEVFYGRNYGAFAFLAGVRNYSAITPLSEPRGLPDDFFSSEYEADALDAHSESWFSGEELAAIDFSEVIEDRRYMKELRPGFFDGGATCEPGRGELLPLAEFLGPDYVADLKAIAQIPDSRVVFWFDN